MKELLSLLLFGVGALCFLVFFATLKPDTLAAVAGPSRPDHCSTTPSATLACRPHLFAAAVRPNVGYR